MGDCSKRNDFNDLGYQNSIYLERHHMEPMLEHVKQYRQILKDSLRASQADLINIQFRKEDAQQLSIGDLRGIVDNLNRLGMPSRLRRYLIVSCRRCRAAGISRRRFNYALHSLKHRLGSPETTAREYR